MPNLDKLSINLATVREQWDLRQAIEGCERAGIGAIAPWRDMVAKAGLKESVRLVRASGMTVTGLCRGGMFPAPDEAGRRANIEDNRRALEEAASLGAKCLVLVVGGLPRGSKDVAGTRGMVEDGIAAILPEARALGVPLAIEPMHPMYAADRGCVNTLRQALDLCDRLGPGLGVAVDVYHVWWDPEAAAEIARAGPQRLLAFHICDWLVPTAHMLLDRGMMGDGVIDIPRVRSWIESAGYQGHHEVEIFSANHWWRRDPDEVISICIERYRNCC